MIVYFSKAYVASQLMIEVATSDGTKKELTWFEKGETSKLIDTEWNEDVILNKVVEVFRKSTSEKILDEEGIKYDITLCTTCPNRSNAVEKLKFKPFKLKDEQQNR